ncbi:MAG: hypothetical protein M1444_00065 [Patescibacteria group bacterium]|nr:hypothetical protein [Patescibacteria group bacterium]
MPVEIPRSQDKAETQATRIQRLGYFLASVGVVLIGRALIVNDEEFIRGVEAAGGALSLASSLLPFEQARFIRGEAQIQHNIEELEERLDPYRLHDTSKPPVPMITEY